MFVWSYWSYRLFDLVLAYASFSGSNSRLEIGSAKRVSGPGKVGRKTGWAVRRSGAKIVRLTDRVAELTAGSQLGGTTTVSRSMV